MLGLEYYGVLQPFGVNSRLFVFGYGWTRVLYKVIITAAACYAVAFLSGFLSEQTRRTRKKLQMMEEHVKRVEKMASLGEMAAGLAHEIKNPLASLSASIQVLREEAHDPENDRLMQIVTRETDRLTSLVSDFLMFAKPPTGNIENIRLDKSLNEILELFIKDGATRGQLEIDHAIIPDVWVEMDPMHLRQVVWNLLLNASEAIDGEGKIQVEMVTYRNKRVEIVVSDNGAGIEGKKLGSIFDPFYTTKHSGTGLGLSIVHRILAYYDSRLDVESHVGEGTVVKFGLKMLAPPKKKPLSKA
jgi:two-component system sensor histidine kinase PilS (NtrC family)